ncbi:hypothetical protein L1049_022896 [Liquidambar formosana]|uniref:Uncharacterized protein n=1 Tax=Liquidambar formosana TaxID=63359 RepID=A0AAP0RD57_LIQFO
MVVVTACRGQKKMGCGKDRATVVGVENCKDAVETMAEEEEDEVEFIPSSFGLEASVSEGVHTSRPQLPTHPLALTASTHQKKKARKDALVEAIAGIEASLSLKVYKGLVQGIIHTNDEARR